MPAGDGRVAGSNPARVEEPGVRPRKAGGGVDGLAVSGDQDALPVVPPDESGRAAPARARYWFQVSEPGAYGRSGSDCGGSAERGLDLIPGTPVGLAVVRAAQSRLDVDWQSERAGQDLR